MVFQKNIGNSGQIIVKYTKKTTCNYLLTDPEIDWRNALVERTEKIKELAEYPHCQPTYWVMNSGRVKSQMFDMQSQPSMRPVQSKPASIASGRSLAGLHGPINWQDKLFALSVSIMETIESF